MDSQMSEELSTDKCSSSSHDEEETDQDLPQSDDDQLPTKIHKFFNSMSQVPNWKERDLNAAGHNIHFLSLAKILQPHELNRINGHKMEWRIELLGSNFKIIPNAGLHSMSLCRALSQALTKDERAAAKIKKYIRKYIVENWDELQENFEIACRKNPNYGGPLYKTFREYKRASGKSNSPASVVELVAAAYFFQFNFCLIIAWGSYAFAVLNHDALSEKSETSEDDRYAGNQLLQPTATQVRYYFLQTGTTIETTSFQLLQPLNKFACPINGKYPFMMKRVLHVHPSANVQNQSTSKLKNLFWPSPSTAAGNMAMYEADENIFLTLAYKRNEFVYKDLGNFPHSLFGILAEFFFHSSISGYKIKKELDLRWEELDLKSHEMKLAVQNQEFPGNSQYLELASKVYEFNYFLVEYNTSTGRYFTKLQHHHLDGKSAEIPWLYFFVKTSSKVAKQNEWYTLHLLDNAEEHLEIIREAVESSGNDGSFSSSWTNSSKFLSQLESAESYNANVEEYIQNIAHLFKTRSNHSECSLVVKPQYYSKYLKMRRPIVAAIHQRALPFIEYKIGKDEQMKVIPLGHETSGYSLVNHEGGISEFLPYMELEHTKKRCTTTRHLKH